MFESKNKIFVSTMYKSKTIHQCIINFSSFFFSELVQGKKYVNKIRRSSKAVGNDKLAEMLEGLEKLMKKERIQSQAKKSAERRERRASRLPLLREKT